MNEVKATTFRYYSALLYVSHITVRSSAVTEDLKAQRAQCAERISDLEQAHAACIPHGDDPTRMVGPYTPKHMVRHFDTIAYDGQYVKVGSPFLSDIHLTILATQLTPSTDELVSLAEESAQEMRRRHAKLERMSQPRPI